MQGRHANLGAAMADILALPPAVGARRNSRFAAEAKRWLRGRQCAYCQAPADEAHHLYPFWWFPSLEMDKRFWLPVCRRGEDHHLHLAHLGSFERFDVLAREHAAIFKFCRRMSGMVVKLVQQVEKKPKSRRELQAMLAELAAVA
jgi:hypothetical protein